MSKINMKMKMSFYFYFFICLSLLGRELARLSSAQRIRSWSTQLAATV